MEPQEDETDLAVPDTWSEVSLSSELQAQLAQEARLRAEPVPAIIIAARDGDVDALRRELDLGVSVDLADAWKSTPLQVACGAKEVSEETGSLVPIERGDRFACAKLLVSRGACLDAGFPGCPEGLCLASGNQGTNQNII